MNVNKRIITPAIVVLLLAVTFAGLATVPVAAQSYPSEMQFRYNAQHTGDYSPVAGLVPSNGQLKWNFTTGAEASSSPAVADGVVYVGSNDHNVYALYASNGTEKWRFTTGWTVPSSPAVVDGVVYVGSEDHNVYALYANNGTEMWRFTTGNYLYSSPAVANGIVYIGSIDGNVYAINATTGTKLWNFWTGSEVWSSPAVADGVVYVGGSWSWDHNVYAINATTGIKLWNFWTGAGVYSSPAVADGVVYVGSNDHNVYALYASNGTEKWSYTTGAPIWSTPAVANGIVYIGSSDGNVYAINATTGTKLWNFTTGAGVSSSPAVVNGVVYVGSTDHNVYAIGQPTPPPNQAPTANAGAGQTAVVGSTVTLDGSHSSDPDNNLPLTYAWSIQSTPAGSTAQLSSTTVAQPTFTPDKPGDYVFALTVKDSLGLQCTTPATVKITANPANAAPSVTAVTVPIDPQRVNDPVSVSAAFTDPDLADTHTATWTWGDGTTSAGTITENNGAGTVSGSHVYAEAGVYTISVKVTDNHDASAEATAQSYVVVYNPDGGFVTGGGWITSPTGAYAKDPALTGKATFGFVSKYQKGANTPTGNTEFQFTVANLNFKSTSYDWLVIAGAKAQYKGTGTINGAGSYKFMLSAVDGNLKGTGPDTFRMKIWDDNGVVYDNLAGAPDTAAPTTTLGGGSIVIHP